MNQCPLCERITGQKLAFWSPLTHGRQNRKKGEVSFKQREEVKIERAGGTSVFFIEANGPGAFIH